MVVQEPPHVVTLSARLSREDRRFRRGSWTLVDRSVDQRSVGSDVSQQDGPLAPGSAALCSILVTSGTCLFPFLTCIGLPGRPSRHIHCTEWTKYEMYVFRHRYAVNKPVGRRMVRMDDLASPKGDRGVSGAIEKGQVEVLASWARGNRRRCRAKHETNW